MTLNEAAFTKAFEAYWDAQPPGTETGLRAAIAAYLEEASIWKSSLKSAEDRLVDALKSKENA